MINREKKILIFNVFFFSKFAKFENYIQWNRQMIHEIKFVELYNFIDDF